MCRGVLLKGIMYSSLTVQISLCSFSFSFFYGLHRFHNKIIEEKRLVHYHLVNNRRYLSEDLKETDSLAVTPWQSQQADQPHN